VTRVLLFQMNVPKSYWGEAVLTAAYLINRVPSRVLDGQSPIEFISSFFPSVPFLSSLHSRVFGCVVFVHIHSQFHGKLDPRAVKCIFVGYASNKKGYRCYHPLSRKFFTSMDVPVDEIKSFYESPQLQGESSFEVESSESLESSFNPFIQEPSRTTFGSPNTSRTDVSEVAPNKGIFVPKSTSAPEISHDSEVAHNKGNFGQLCS